jgi:4-hydroxy-2-oxoheptanedioate aldolase
MVVVLLEEVEALENIEEILKVDNIDVFFVAPSDLAQTMGHIGNAEHPEVQAAIETAIGKIVNAGRTPGTLANDANIDKFKAMGVKFMMTSWNAWVVRGASDFLKKASA